MSEPKKRTLKIKIEAAEGGVISPKDIDQVMKKCGAGPNEEWKKSKTTTTGSRSTENFNATWFVDCEE